VALRRLQYTMSKVRKWDGEGTFAGTRDNDGVAPIAAVPETEAGPIEAADSGHPPTIIRRQRYGWTYRPLYNPVQGGRS
jgi:hypothetical protein